MKTLVRPSGKINYVNAGAAISAGDVVDLGTMIGIAIVDIAASTGEGQIALDGVHELAKENSVAHAVGDLVYYDGTECTKTPGSSTLAGVVVKAAGSSVRVVDVDINRGVPPRTSSMSASEYFSVAHTVTSGEASANQVDIDTGFGEAPTGKIINVLRSGVDVKEDAIVSNLTAGDAGKVRIADGGATYNTTAGDIIYLFAWLD